MQPVPVGCVPDALTDRWVCLAGARHDRALLGLEAKTACLLQQRGPAMQRRRREGSPCLEASSSRSRPLRPAPFPPPPQAMSDKEFGDAGKFAGFQNT